MVAARREGSVPSWLKTAIPGRGLACAAGCLCPASPKTRPISSNWGQAPARAGLDGYFLWDHLVHADSGTGPPVVDPWPLAVVAARTSRIKLGTMITPVARRRPWKLAKEVTTLDLLSGGRVILGVGLATPAQSEFSLFGEPADTRRTARNSWTRGWTSWRDCAGPGQPFSHEGKHFTVGPVEVPAQPGAAAPDTHLGGGGPSLRGAAGPGRPPGGPVPPARGPVARAARWDGFVPINPGRPGDRATVGEIAAVWRGTDRRPAGDHRGFRHRRLG